MELLYDPGNLNLCDYYICHRITSITNNRISTSAIFVVGQRIIVAFLQQSRKATLVSRVRHGYGKPHEKSH